MGGGSAKRKGASFELEVVKDFAEQGLYARKMPLSGALGGEWGGDVIVPVRAEHWKLECKRRKRSFSTLYGYLNNVQAAVIRDDRTESLVVLRLSDFVKLARLNP